MFQINNLRVNADKFYDYLDDRLFEIEKRLKEDKDCEFSNLTLNQSESRISMTVAQSSKIKRKFSSRTDEILDVDCEKFDLSSYLNDQTNVRFYGHQIFDLTDLFKKDMIEDENVVFVILGDVSEEPYSVEYYIKGIFTDIDRAFEHVNDTFDSIVATKLDAANDFYVGGYME